MVSNQFQLTIIFRKVKKASGKVLKDKTKVKVAH